MLVLFFSSLLLAFCCKTCYLSLHRYTGSYYLIDKIFGATRYTRHFIADREWQWAIGCGQVLSLMYDYIVRDMRGGFCRCRLRVFLFCVFASASSTITTHS